MDKKLKPIPRFRNEAAERKFWETHDSTDYVDWSKARRVQFPNLKLSTTAISLRLPQGLLDRIKVAAFQRGVIAIDRPPHCFSTIVKTGLHTPYRSIRFFHKILSPILSWCQARTASCLSCRPVESGKEPR